MRRPGGYQDKQLLVAHGVPELLQAAQRRGASLHQLLAGTTLFETDLQKPQFRIHPGALQRLLGNLNKVPSPELPAVIAQAILLNPQIPVCRLILSAPTLSKALRYLWFYRQQLWPLCLPVLQWQGATLRMNLLPAVGMGAAQGLALASPMPTPTRASARCLWTTRTFTFQAIAFQNGICRILCEDTRATGIPRKGNGHRWHLP